MLMMKGGEARELGDGLAREARETRQRQREPHGDKSQGRTRANSSGGATTRLSMFKLPNALRGVGFHFFFSGHTGRRAPTSRLELVWRLGVGIDY